jgi:hypothetical protein
MPSDMRSLGEFAAALTERCGRRRVPKNTQRNLIVFRLACYPDVLTGETACL